MASQNLVLVHIEQLHLYATRAQVNVRLKADRGAVAASGVCLLHITPCLGGRRLDLIVTAAYELQ